MVNAQFGNKTFRALLITKISAGNFCTRISEKNKSLIMGKRDIG